MKSDNMLILGESEFSSSSKHSSNCFCKGEGKPYDVDITFLSFIIESTLFIYLKLNVFFYTLELLDFDNLLVLFWLIKPTSAMLLNNFFWFSYYFSRYSRSVWAFSYIYSRTSPLCWTISLIYLSPFLYAEPEKELISLISMIFFAAKYVFWTSWAY